MKPLPKTIEIHHSPKTGGALSLNNSPRLSLLAIKIMTREMQMMIYF
jgi:hypothetical protein